MTLWLSLALTATRLALVVLAGRAVWHALTLPRGRHRRRQIAIGAVGLLGAALA